MPSDRERVGGVVHVGAMQRGSALTGAQLWSRS
jgi:hypothetical protein